MKRHLSFGWFGMFLVAFASVALAQTETPAEPSTDETTASTAATATSTAATATPAPPAAPPPTEVRSDEGTSSDASEAPPAPAWVDSDAGENATDTDASALTDFDATLRPHGRWVEDATYGTVWVPAREAVGPNFAPYVTGGHWALTPSGQWLWVSDYPFGWVVFHYGRWVYVPQLGWSWIPGRAYAPAWVVFRSSVYGDPYLGWAPLPPRYVWRHGRAVWLVRVPPAPYVFCATRWVFRPHVGSYVLRNRRRTRLLAERSRRYVPSRPGRVGPAGPNLEQARVAPSDAPKARITRTLRVPVRTRVASEPGAPPRRAPVRAAPKPKKRRKPKHKSAPPRKRKRVLPPKRKRGSYPFAPPRTPSKPLRRPR
jgi:hypothetical protein